MPATATPQHAKDRPRPRLAVAISGSGTTLLNLHQRIQQGKLHADIACVIASNPKSFETVRDKRLGPPTPPTLGLYRNQFDDKHAYSNAFFQACRDADADLVCLAGFLCLLVIPDDYAGRVLNIHPSLLPKFGGKGMHGRHVHQAVLDQRETESGCTVHLADNTYDTGPVILQKTCPVQPDDTPETLAARVFGLECEAYPQAIATLWQRIQNDT